MGQMDRDAARCAKRVVVKVGSRALVGDDPQKGRIQIIADQIERAMGDDRAIILVSSGAVLFGWKRLGFSHRPRLVGRLQASFSAGQSHLMQAYDEAFSAHGRTVAQVLLTYHDLEDRERYLHARSAVDALLDLGAVPVINENGTVAFDELAGFGDNDQLAAMVATLVGADLLVLCSDVEGLLDEDGKRVPWVEDFQKARALVRPKESSDSLGGMESKIDAAERATQLGVPVALVDAFRDDILDRVLDGEDVGTWFAAREHSLTNRKHWIAFTLKPRGSIYVDDGAMKALVRGKRSLLLAGVSGVVGDFQEGDAVRILGPSGKEFARGLARYQLIDVARMAGEREDQVESLTGKARASVVVHRDDMVVY